MKKLMDLTNKAIKNSPEFINENLIAEIINPLEKQDFEFIGYSASGNIDYKVGLHLLIFEDRNKTRKNYNDLLIPKYDDDGTSSTHQLFYGTLFIYIPMPF